MAAKKVSVSKKGSAAAKKAWETRRRNAQLRADQDKAVRKRETAAEAEAGRLEALRILERMGQNDGK